MSDGSATVDVTTVLEFMLRLGQAHLACGEQTAKIELTLRRIAAAYGMRHCRVVAFPTALFIATRDGDEERTTLAEGPTETLRLDQIAEVYSLGEAAQRAEVAPRQGLERLNAILRQPARLGRVGVVLGHTILAAGLAMVLNPTFTEGITAAILGFVVGLLKLFNRGRAVLAVPMPVVSAAVVSTLVFIALRRGLAIDPINTLIPPLVTFLPGAMLALGMVELAYGDMVSGSSRLITGFVQLVLLAFGLAAGAMLVGYAPESLMKFTKADPTSILTPWAGVLVFGFGAYLHFSAPPGSFLWIAVVLLFTFAAQRTAAALFGSEISGFFGSLVATPLGYLIQLRFKGPPAVVTFLPSFWLLVPGALGLFSATRMLSDRLAGVEGFVAVVFVVTSIVLGTLVGATLYKWLTERFGAWRLQIGRAGSYLRQRRR